MNHNNLLILERSSSTLSFESKNGEYVLEGVFGEIDKKNRNNRIYTESEYVPQIEALQEKIKSSKLLGELDHPAKFDISLKNVSHVIEDLYYDKESKEVRGKIRLLDTDAGKQAKALVDAGVPLQISSRAAGAVESNGQVKIKQLFTYDLVADPGFENAQLNRVNESYGLSNDSNISIFEINGDMITEETIETENKIENNQIMENQARFVSVEDFNKYSAYLAEEIKALKESLANDSTDNIEEKVNALTSYVEYVAERADKGIQYTEYVAENLDKNIDYSNYIAEKLDESISYTEHVAESASKIKEYTNYLAEAMNEGAADVTKYLNYLKENVESVSEYADYIAETINTNLIVEEEGEEAGVPAEEMEDELNDETPEVIDADGEEYAKAEDRAEDESDELEDEIIDGEDGAKEVAESEEEEVAEEDDLSDEEAEAVKDMIDDHEDEMHKEDEEVEESEEGAKDLEEIEDEEVEAGDNSEEGSVSDNGEEAGEEAEDMEADHKEVNSEDDKKITKDADQEMPSEDDVIDEEVEESYEDLISKLGLNEENFYDRPEVKKINAAIAKLKEAQSKLEDALDKLDDQKRAIYNDEGPTAKYEAIKKKIDAGNAKFDKIDDKIKSLRDKLDSLRENNSVEAEEEMDAVESYKAEISEKLSALINKATEKKNDNPHFFKFVSEATQNKYNELEEADKAKVLANVEGRGYLTESQITTLMESALVEVAGQTEPYFIEAMPSEYKETWAKLSEAKKSAIAAQAKMVKLSTPYQVKNFWDTRDLREVAPVMEKVEMVSESKEVEAPKSTITYNTDGIAEELAKRFNK